MTARPINTFAFICRNTVTNSGMQQTCKSLHASIACSHLDVQRPQLPVELLGADLAHGVVE
jgi:hypothetical protein